MRITLVSAHYPPNFVSGGTLQPQRLAHGLLGRGHDVRVFAGHLDSRRRPLDTWEETDSAGLPVRWLVTTPWIDWAAERNYDNPEAASHFRAHLRDHPADVVHLHTLQGLGVGLVEEAAASGAATVVTMHDFWWACARQFLVDREVTPCCLVVAAGDCACEDGRPHLDRRAARLAVALATADLVLAPSRSAAEVLEANGVRPDRLRVDENGMLDPDRVALPVRRRAPADDHPVVVRYTGGSNPMKGADVLLAAARELGRRPDLRILAHDLDDAWARHDLRLADTSLELLPAYLPNQLDALLAETDALVLPSVMRESHSLVTREALLRGVPVIATDTIGPEEVVTDGVNGLIVPAADSHLLARAIRSLLEPDTRRRLTAGASEPPTVRSLDDQLTGLEATFTDLVAAGARRQPPRPSVRTVLFVVGIEGAPLRYRAHLPAEALALVGVASEVRHYRDPAIDDLARDADVVVVYRVPATHQVLDLIRRVRGRGSVVVFDVDDLIFDPDIAEEIPALRLLPPDEAHLWLDGVERYRTTMEACDAYVGSTPALVAHARSVVGIDAHLFENGVGMSLGAASDIARRSPRRPGPPRIGYFSGTTTHDDDWRHVEAAVVGALVEHPDAELWLGGLLEPTPAVIASLGDRVRRIPFTDWMLLPDRLRQLDVNLAPLEPGSRFNEAKSAIKWLEAALVGVPTIASPSGPFRGAIDSGHTGWLADTPDQWRDAIAAALQDPDLRTTVGVRAQRAALLGWSPHRQAVRYLEILEAVRHRAAAERRVANPAWVPNVADEPVEVGRRPLEPYPPSLAGSTRGRRRPRTRIPVAVVIRTKAARVRESLREEGALGAMRGAGRVAARVAARVARAVTRPSDQR